MIAKYMGWSWAEVQTTPEDVLDVVMMLIHEEQEAIAEARQARS